MAEAAGLVLGALSLASLFDSCFKAYEKVSALGRYGVDLGDASIKLQIEQQVLVDTQRKLDRISLPDQVGVLAPVILTRIKEILDEIERTVARSVVKTSQGGAETASNSTNTASKGLAKNLVQRSFQKIRWVAGDKALLDERFSHLRYFTNAILTLAMSEADRAGEAYLLRRAAIISRDDMQLTDVALACRSEHPDIAQAARVKQLLLRNVTLDGHAAQDSLPSVQYDVSAASIDWADPGGLNHAVCHEWALGTLEGNGGNVDLQRRERAATVPVLVEWRGPFVNRNLVNPVQARLNVLCQLLRTMYSANTDAVTSTSAATPNTFSHEQSINFGMLECLGWTCTSDAFERIGLIFRCPPPLHSPHQHPKSLAAVISTHRQKGFVPELGNRFDLAFSVTSAVANILAVGWVHRAVRSSNVVLFDAKDICHVYLLGLAYAREEEASEEFSNLPEHPDSAFYRPPRHTRLGWSDSDGETSDDEDNDADAARARLNAEPVTIDMFGLGIVLLEIGLWQTARRLAKSTKSPDAYHFLRNDLPGCMERLLPRCGRLYYNVVEQCLRPDAWGSHAVDNKLAGLLTSLKECRA